MDARIIMSFKRHYHNLHIKWILTQVEEGNDKEFKNECIASNTIYY